MNRLEILLLDRRNGVICNEKIDVQSVLDFLHRTGNVRRFQIVARRGKQAIYIDNIDILTIGKELNDFALQRPPQHTT